MTYQELRDIYIKYIEIPCMEKTSNAIDIALDLGLAVKNSMGCKQDFPDKNPLRNNDAIYALFKGEFTIYYDEKSAYKNFAIAHEIAHHLLRHTSDGVEQHHDANILAAIIVTTNKEQKTESAITLSEKYKIPYVIAREYYAELKSIM